MWLLLPELWYGDEYVIENDYTPDISKGHR